MKKLSQTILLLILSFSFPLQAADQNSEYGLGLQIENQIESRILNVVRTFDSSAQVLVKVYLATIKTSLPGTNVEYEGTIGLTEIKNINQDQISKVEVKILTKAVNFPSSLEQLVKQQIGLPSSKYSMVIEKMDAEVVKQIENENPYTLLGRKIENVFEKNHTETRLVYLLALCLGLAFFVLQFVSARKLRNVFAKTMQDFQMKSNSQELEYPSRQVNRPVDIESRASQPLQLGSQDNSLNDLPLNALVSLFTDSYWTKEDGYAAWLWQQLSAQHRVNVLKNWEFANEYIQFLSQVPMKTENYHNHPYYLNAVDFSQVSQEDLAHWMQSYPHVWKMLSPMRQATLPISIFQKVEWAALEKPTNVDFIPPKTKSQKRLLNNVSAFGEVTELDELKVLENPQIISENMRSKVPTLAWLALESLETRTNVLADFNAQELAQAWVGHKDILSKLQEALPETKFKLIESYLKNVRPSRQSSVYGALVTRSLTIPSPEIEKVAA